MSWILLLLLWHAGVSTDRRGDMSWILSSMMLHTGVSAIGMDYDYGGEYCIEFIVCILFTLHLLNKKRIYSKA